MTNLELKLIATDRNEEITDACMDKLNSDIKQYNDDVADVDDEMLIDILEELAADYADGEYTINFIILKIDGNCQAIHESSDYGEEDNYVGEATITVKVV